MTWLRRLPLLALLWLAACTAAPAPEVPLTLITAEGQAVQTRLSAQTAAQALQALEIQLAEDEALLLNGRFISPETPLDCPPCTLQIRPRQSVQLDEAAFASPAFTLGEALTAAGYAPSFGDRLSPGAATALDAPRRVVWQEGETVRVQVGAWETDYRLQAETVAQALSQIGLLPQGLDYTQPALEAPLPAESPIRLVRVREAVLLQPRALPFETIRQPDPDLPLDQQAVLQAGEYGLALQRTRIRYEDGQETARLEEVESLLRPPQPQILAYGTRVTLQTIETPYGPLQYWRAIQMYATSYSPCRSAADRCYYQTASGVPVQQGVVAMTRDWYLALRGMRVYVPGYGIASIEDVGGGFPDGRPWIDLGYSDDDYQIWSGWVTVYFLAPAPAEIPWMLR